MNVCALCACFVFLEVRRGHWKPWNWCERLLQTIWSLRTKVWFCVRATRALNSLTNFLISCMKNIFAKMFLCTNCQLILLFRHLDIIIWHHFLMYKQDDYTLQLSGRSTSVGISPELPIIRWTFIIKNINCVILGDFSYSFLPSHTCSAAR